MLKYFWCWTLATFCIIKNTVFYDYCNVFFNKQQYVLVQHVNAISHVIKMLQNVLILNVFKYCRKQDGSQCTNINLLSLYWRFSLVRSLFTFSSNDQWIDRFLSFFCPTTFTSFTANEVYTLPHEYVVFVKVYWLKVYPIHNFRPWSIICCFQGWLRLWAV